MKPTLGTGGRPEFQGYLTPPLSLDQRSVPAPPPLVDGPEVLAPDDAGLTTPVPP